MFEVAATRASTILLIERTPAVIQSWRNVLGDLWPDAEVQVVGYFAQAERRVMQGGVLGLVIGATADDGHPIDFLSNARMLLPEPWAFLIDAIPSAPGVSRLLGVRDSFDPGMPENSLFRAVGEAFHRREESLPELDCLLRGSLSSLPLADLVQMKSLLRKRALIRITSADGSCAQLEFNEQGLCHCELGMEVGEEAFYRLIHWQDGLFEEVPCEAEPEVSIAMPWEQLIMEAAQRQDEGTLHL